jgi:hypothetical protein
MNTKDQIIAAIQGQHWLKISFRKETDGDWVTRVVAPYDVYRQQNKNDGYDQDILLGYAKGDYQHRSHVVSIYLNNIHGVELVGETFDGDQIRHLIKPKHRPYVERSW